MAEARAKQFRSLHRPGRPVVFANVYDQPTAEVVASNPSSEALATASYAIAAVNGVEDDALDLDTNLAALQRIVPTALKHGKPITVDMQDGYGDQLEHAITSIIELGASGCNIEDRDNGTGELLPIDAAAARIQRACQAAAKAGVPSFVVNARTDAVLVNGGDVDDAIVRGQAYLEAGAATVFVWGGPRGLCKNEVTRLCDAFNGRLNVLARLTPDGLTLRELADIGVSRISIGPALWRHAMDAFRERAESHLQQAFAVRN